MKNNLLQYQLSQWQRARFDIANWRTALLQAENVNNPRRAALLNIYHDVSLDATLTAQINHFVGYIAQSDWELVDAKGKLLEEPTAQNYQDGWIDDAIKLALESSFFGHSLMELSEEKGVYLLPRKHVEPVNGLFLAKETDRDGVLYRELPWYGKSLVEYGNPHDLGILNKAVPHVLIKRFAQSCWSEFAEIFGMPIRYLKTNTADPELLARAEQMLQQMGSNASAVIDTTEDLQFIQNTQTKGEVYAELIRLCDQQISLLVSGAILGQDTQHGTRGKEQVSANLMQTMIDGHKNSLERWANKTLLPALATFGKVPANAFFRFVYEEDLDALWNKTVQASTFAEIDTDWVKNKFGIEVKGPKASTSLSLTNGSNPAHGFNRGNTEGLDGFFD